MRAVVKAVLSFMLTSWTYSEIMLVCPELAPISEKIITSLTIPTHDEWRVYYDKEHQTKVTEDLNSFLTKVGLDVQSDQSNDLEEVLEIPQKVNTHNNGPNHVSIFENSNHPKMLYESFF